MAARIASRLVALTLLAWLATVGLLPVRAHAAIPENPEGGCQAQASSSFDVMESWLGPPSGTTVTADSPVTFSTHSETPLTIAVASSPGLISSPDIDSGTMSRVPFTEEPGPQTSFTYTYTSTVATNTPGTVYWQATTSSAYIEPCASFAPYLYRTDIRTLRIFPKPVEVSIERPAGLSRTQAVTYSVRCTITCTGDTYYQAYVLSHHAGARRIPMLDSSPTPVSIVGVGTEPFVHGYTGSALRTLDGVIRAHEAMEIEISVKVTDSSGNVVRAHSTDTLRFATSSRRRKPS
jgi:hypothetical protein